MHVSQTRCPKAAESTVLNSGHFFVTHDHLCKEGITKDDLLNPTYWVHVAGRLDVGHEIKVLAEDFSFRAILLVTKSQVNVGADVKIVEFNDLSASEGTNDHLADFSQGYEIKWRAARKFSIVDKSGRVIKEDIQTKEEAERELRSYTKALVA